MRMIRIIALIGLGLALAGCFKPNVQQGNLLPATAVQKLHTGMTRADVIDLLGDPVLEQPIHNNQLVYVHEFKHGFDDPQVQRLTLTFDRHDRLVKINKH